MVNLAPHQLKALTELGSGKILLGETGSGKSRTALAYYIFKECGGTRRVNGEGDYSPMKTPKDLYIITTARKRDKYEWEDELAHYAYSKKENVDGVEVVIDSWNNIGKYKEVENAFFIFDEQRLVGSGAWVKSFYKIAKKNRWILLTATPGDTWTDYIPVFVANGFYRNKTEFNDTHVIYNRYTRYPSVDKYVGTKKLQRCRDSILVNMEFQKHTIRHFEDLLVEYDSVRFKDTVKRRWHEQEDRPFRNRTEMFYNIRQIVNTDPSRVSAIEKLLRDHPKLIIFYNFDYELEILRKLGESYFGDYAEWNGHKHEEVPTSDSWIYAVQYTAASEAWNCTTTNAMVFYSLNYSYRIMKQSEGRIDRMNTPYTDLYYYRLYSRSWIDLAILKALKQKKNFNESYYRFETKEKAA